MLIPVDHKDSPYHCNYSDLDVMSAYPRYRVLVEGYIENYDGFTIPEPRDVAGLDLNRNFPSGWSKAVTGSGSSDYCSLHLHLSCLVIHFIGEHAASEPEVDYLVKVMGSRPNICGANAYHTAGGILLRLQVNALVVSQNVYLSCVI